MSLHINARARSVLDLIGNTPMIRLGAAEKRAGEGRQIWAKCEFENPGGSVKDRAARQMILDALADGRLSKGKILIDSTSGNTGVAYSMLGAALGIPITLVMPANVSVARKNITADGRLGWLRQLTTMPARKPSSARRWGDVSDRGGRDRDDRSRVRPRPR